MVFFWLVQLNPVTFSRTKKNYHWSLKKKFFHRYLRRISACALANRCFFFFLTKWVKTIIVEQFLVFPILWTPLFIPSSHFKSKRRKANINEFRQLSLRMIPCLRLMTSLIGAKVTYAISYTVYEASTTEPVCQFIQF